MRSPNQNPDAGDDIGRLASPAVARKKWLGALNVVLDGLPCIIETLNDLERVQMLDWLETVGNVGGFVIRSLRPRGGARAHARWRDSKGVPVIPGLADDAAMAFDDLWEEARKWPFDDACCKLAALHELAKHHPALAPEMALLRQLDQIHDALTNNVISERLRKI